jgi:homospermidine synthase
VLTIDEARKLVPNQSATTVQVAASVMAATVWMIENPERGVLLPDDLDHERVLEVASRYFGTYVSEAVDWSPLDNRDESALFERFNPPTIRTDDPDEEWQFTTFLV